MSVEGMRGEGLPRQAQGKKIHHYFPFQQGPPSATGLKERSQTGASESASWPGGGSSQAQQRYGDLAWHSPGSQGSPIQVVFRQPVDREAFTEVSLEGLREEQEAEEGMITASAKKSMGGGKGKGSRSGLGAVEALRLDALPRKRKRPEEGTMAVPGMRAQGGWVKEREQESMPKKKPGRPVGSKNKFSTPSSTGEGQAGVVATVTMADGTVMNRRGRPKGWKPGMKYSTLRPPNPNARRKPAASGARRGRPPTKSLTPHQIHHHEAVTRTLAFTNYICEWRGCAAELHDLPTLRRHVSVIHLRGDEERPCLWGKCAGEAGGRGQVTAGGVYRHMERKHFTPLAWHAGDGPRNSLEAWEVLVAEYREKRAMREGQEQGRHDDAGGEGRRAASGRLPRWLFDENGVQVTESVEGQRTENPAERRARMKRILAWQRENLYTDSESEGEGEAARG